MYEGLEDELYASADPYDSMPFGDLMRARDRELDEDADAERAERDADEALGDAAHGEWRIDPNGIAYFVAFDDSLLPDALQALKDILNASGNSQPYTTRELESFVAPILGRAYKAGIRLPGEE